ncbi:MULTISPECIES: hypothetical protein [Delftia]|uniref:Uncharacterized protein n=1 Tax=Delftia lacustris TaxID=558537 RepID=A0A7T3DE26_9BURK|nr:MULTISPECIES: hypothetical protein [Delftia]EPD46307.1 hypothetical protein HMPREF9702_00330 [Delftia acidovorans CCUG 15835]QPS80899.1 hypothetical protein I6G47_28660 [Delftia lacustris]
MSFNVSYAAVGRAAGPLCLCLLAGVVGAVGLQEMLTTHGTAPELAKNYGATLAGAGLGVGLLTGLRTALSFISNYRERVKAVLRQHAKELPEPQRSVALRRANSDDEEVLGEALTKAGALCKYDALLSEAFVPPRFRRAAGFVGVGSLMLGAYSGASSALDSEDDYAPHKIHGPSLNTDGTPMVGDSGLDTNGNSYGHTDN